MSETFKVPLYFRNLGPGEQLLSICLYRNKPCPYSCKSGDFPPLDCPRLFVPDLPLKRSPKEDQLAPILTLLFGP